MKKNKYDRLSIINDLVNLNKPIDDLLIILKKYSWDYKGNEYIITSNHLINILEKNIKSQITKHDIEKWANAIESREDIGFDKNNKYLSDIIYKLANPYLEGELTSEFCNNTIKKLKMQK